MTPFVSIIIPAWNEAGVIGTTLRSLCALKRVDATVGGDQLIVVDDGSDDCTSEEASHWADIVIRHPTNLGKGAALKTGILHAQGAIIVFLDADLGPTAHHYRILLKPLQNREADMSIAIFPAVPNKAGLGLVKTLARIGIRKLSGYDSGAPLSGQRAVTREVLQSINGFADGFGIEVGLTIDMVRKGYRICEVPVPFDHRLTGSGWNGYCHRGKQFCSISKTLWRKWRETP